MERATIFEKRTIKPVETKVEPLKSLKLEEAAVRRKSPVKATIT
ncbi:hypothetical protein COLO4_17544 [Corchorus olitorius]|uniref:Uncharacterized protein n=1 Tax=Corchorus olitorius TaxID=93759 RepID=A0A1R3JCA7_9ROSI|nr:hypothetical protein COLO4_17544 [Corchorus olitorius]